MRWKVDELGREDLLVRKIRLWIFNAMSSALSCLHHNMLIGIVMYYLLKYQFATSQLLRIVAKFYMNIMPLRPSEIHNF
jgi:hypothetical protein